MIKAGQIDKGTFLLIKEAPYQVVEREFVNPGKGSAFARVKMKNLLTGQVLKQTFKTQDNVEDIDVSERKCQYLYCDGASYHFMEEETYEQFEVPYEGMEEKQLFMKDGEVYWIVFWGTKPIEIKIPYKVTFIVTEAPEAIKGDTATNVTKLCTCDTGLQVKTPIFIREGDKILVNTETKEYVERVNS
jgi:elongation factor P